MALKVARAVLALAMAAALTVAPASAATAATEGAKSDSASLPASAPVARPAAPFVPDDFAVPTLVSTADFKIVPLGPDVVKIDFLAYMSSIEHLQKTFTRSTSWPHKDISDADAMQDMLNEQGRFRERKSFAYAVLTPDGSRERGSVYVHPSRVPGYDAEVRMWVTKADYDAGFDATLFAWVTGWIGRDWPFRQVAYPGRTIDWATWDALIAAKPGK